MDLSNASAATTEREARKKAERRERILADRMGDIQDRYDADRVAADKFDAVKAWLENHNNILNIPKFVFEKLERLDGRHGKGIWDFLLGSVWPNADPHEFHRVRELIRAMIGGRTRGAAPVPDDCKLHAPLVDMGWKVVAEKESERIDPATGLLRAAQKPKAPDVPSVRFVATKQDIWKEQIASGAIRDGSDTFGALVVGATRTREERDAVARANAICVESSSDEDDDSCPFWFHKQPRAEEVAEASDGVEDEVSKKEDDVEDEVSEEDGVEDPDDDDVSVVSVEAEFVG